jgi:hypothetical protein
VISRGTGSEPRLPGLLDADARAKRAARNLRRRTGAAGNRNRGVDRDGVIDGLTAEGLSLERERVIERGDNLLGLCNLFGPDEGVVLLGRNGGARREARNAPARGRSASEAQRQLYK